MIGQQDVRGVRLKRSRASSRAAHAAPVCRNRLEDGHRTEAKADVPVILSLWVIFDSGRSGKLTPNRHWCAEGPCSSTVLILPPTNNSPQSPCPLAGWQNRAIRRVGRRRRRTGPADDLFQFLVIQGLPTLLFLGRCFLLLLITHSRVFFLY